MSDEIFFNGVRYLSAAEAASKSGFTRDYIGRLCRDGKVRGRRVGKNWYVDGKSFDVFLVTQEYSKSLRNESLAKERVREYHELEVVKAPVLRSAPVAAVAGGVSAAAQSISQRSRDIQEQMRRTLSAQNGVVKSVSELAHAPGGFTSAALQVAHVPVYTLTPVMEFAHKLIALTLTLTLVLGTYAAVDPQQARIAVNSVRDQVAAVTDSYHSATGGGIGALADRTQASIAVAANNPEVAAAGVASFFSGSIPQFASNLARSLNSGVDNFLYAIAFPTQLTSSHGSVAVSIKPYAQPEIQSQEAGSKKQGVATSAGGTSKTITTASGGVPSKAVINNYTTLGGTGSQSLAVAGGITQAQLSAQLQQLDNKLSSQMYSISAGQSTTIAQNYAVTAQSNAIDKLVDVAITDATIKGGTISGTSINAKDFTVAGATSLHDTTIQGSLTVNANANQGQSDDVLDLTDASGTVVFGVSPNGTLTTNVSSSTSLISSLLVTGNATATALFVDDLIVADTASTTNLLTNNATSTNFFSTLAHITSGVIDNFTATFASVGGITATNSTTTNATTTNLAVTGNTQLATTTVSGDLTLTGSLNFSSSSSTINANTASTTNFLTLNATSTNLFAVNATSTNLFSTIASSTNLFAQTANLGALFAGTFNLSGLGTFATGFISQASSTIGNGTQAGGLTVSGGATTTGNQLVGGSLSIGTSLPLVITGGGTPTIKTQNGNFYLVAVGDTIGGGTPMIKGTNTAGLVFSSANGGGSVLTLNTSNGASFVGNLGIGTTTPTGKLAVQLNSGETYGGNFAFNIASSTSNSTTTLFSVSNTGLVTANGGLNVSNGSLTLTSSDLKIAASNGIDIANFADINNLTTRGVIVAGTKLFGWTSGTALSDGNTDSGISRLSAGVLGFGTGAQGSTAGGFIASSSTINALNIGGGTANALTYLNGTKQLAAVSVDPSLTFSLGILGINLNNGNSFLGLQQFLNSTSTQLTATQRAYFGATGQSSFDNTGALTLGTPLTQTNGGTGITSYTAGDIIYADNTGHLARLPAGGTGNVLQMQAGLPAWGAGGGGGGGGGGSGLFATSTDNLVIYPADTSKVIVFGGTATSSLNSIFEVHGIQYVSSKLGIATTSPVAPLSVTGNSYLNGNVGIGVSNTGTSGTLLTSGAATLGTTAANSRILTANGSVLINTNTSNATHNDLNIGGIGGWTAGEAHRINFVFDSAADTPNIVNTIESSFDGTYSYMNFRNFNNGGDQTSTLMTIRSDGNVGIGTTTQKSTLAVSGGASIGAAYNIAAPANGLIVQGNVGIGTSTPSQPLTVAGFTSGSAIELTPATNFNGLFGVRLDTAAGSEFAAFKGNPNTGEVRIGATASTYFPTFYSSGSEAARISAAGNFGIGTTSPTGKLAVQLNSTDAAYPGNNAFIIASSTAAATTTLFSVSNTGAATIATTLAVSGTGVSGLSSVLSVTGNGNFTGSVTSGGGGFISNGNVQVNLGSNLQWGSSGGAIQSSTAGQFAFGSTNFFVNSFTLSTPGTATLQLGALDAASPVAQTFQPQSVAAGTSNAAGQNFTINGSRGTGTGAGGSILFQTAPAGTTGSSQNALLTALAINAAGNIGIGSTTPYGKFAINLNSTDAAYPGNFAFTIASSTASATSTLFAVDNRGEVGINSAPSAGVGLTVLNPNGNTGQINLGGSSGAASITAQNGYAFLASTLTSSWQPYIQLISSNGSDHGAIYAYYGGGNVTRASDSGSTFNIINNNNGSNTNVFNIQNSGNVGIATSTPWARLAVKGADTSTATNAFAISNSADNILFTVDNGGDVNIASTTATTTVAGGFSAGNGQVVVSQGGNYTAIQNLQLGALSFDSDAGQVSWADLPVTSASANGTQESYSAQIGGNPVLTVSGLSNGAGGVTNLGVGIGTTTPWGALSVQAADNASVPQFVVASSSATSLLVAANGNVGIGTASPVSMLDVFGSVTLDNSGKYYFVPNGSVPDTNWSLGYVSNPTNARVNSSSSIVQTIYGGSSHHGYTIQSTTGTTLLEIQGQDGQTYLAGNTGIGTTTSYSKLAVQLNNGDTNTLAFNIASSTASATTTLFSVSNTGNVGIGTASTANLLQVNNGATNEFSIDSSGNASVISLMFNQGNRSKINSSGDGTMRFANNAGTSFLDLVVNGAGSYQFGASASSPNAQTFGVGSVTAGNADTAGANWTITGSRGTGLGIGGSIFFQTAPAALSTGSTQNALVTALTISGTGNVGIGTTTPFAKLHIVGPSSTTGNAFEITNSASTTILTVSNAGVLNIGANQGTGIQSNIFSVDSSSSTTTISNLALGNLVFDTDAGNVNLSDIPVDSNAALGVQQSQTIAIGGNPVFTVSGLSNGAGGVTNLGVGIGTTTPWGTLAISTAAQQSGDLPLFNIASTTNANIFTVNGNGNVGIGRPDPGSMLEVAAAASGSTPTVVFGSWNTASIGASLNLDYNRSSAVGTFGAPNPGDIAGFLNFRAYAAGTAKMEPIAQITSKVTGTTSGHPDGDLHFSTNVGAGLLTEQMTLSNLGNLGLGTTTPTGKFAIQLNSTDAAYPGNYAFNIASSTASATTTLFSIGNTGQVLAAQGTQAAPSYSFVGAAGTGMTYVAANAQFQLNYAGNIKFMIDQTSGNHFNTGLAIGSTYINNTSPSNGLIVSGNTGLGTSTPYSLLTLNSSVTTGNALEITNSTGSTTRATFSNSGVLSVGDGVGQSSAIFSIDASSSTTTISNLSIGNLNFDTDGGMLALANLPLSSTPAAGTIESQSIIIGDTPLFTAYAENDGTDNLSQNGKIGVGTTTPWARLSVSTIDNASNPQFVVASSTATSLLIDKNGNVGIGTTSPSTLLHLSAALPWLTLDRSTGTGNDLVVFSQGSVAKAYFGISGSAGGFITGDAAGDLGIRSVNQKINFSSDNGSTIGMTFNNNQLGIGTTSPQALLHVQQSSGAVGIRISRPQASGNPMLQFSDDVSNSANIQMVAGTSNLIIGNTGGNVGIGTSTPNKALTVFGDNGGGYSAMFANSEANSTLAVLTSGGISGLQGLARGGGSTANIFLQASGGNVGIGTNSPGTTLDVLSPGFPGATVRNSTANTYGTALSLDATSVSGGKAWYLFSSGGTAAEGTGKLIFKDNTDGTEPMTIQSNGNIGIGTTTPNSMLSIQNGGTGDQLYENFTAGGTTIGSFGRAVSPNNFFIVNGAFGLQLKDNVGANMTLIGGNVGIGTTTPSTPLFVNTTAAQTAFPTTATYALTLANDTAWGSPGILFKGFTGSNIASLEVLDSGGNSGNFSFKTASGGAALAEKVRITNGGFVGIGTSTPLFNLVTVGGGATSVVQNTNSVSYGANFIFNDLDTLGRSLVTEYSGSSYGSALMSGGPSGESGAIGTTGNFPFALGTNNTARMTITGAGSIGIGTTTPNGGFSVLTANASLQLYGNLDPGAWSASANLGSNSSMPAGLAIGGNRSAGNRETNFINTTPGFTPGGFTFDTWSGTTYTQRVKIDSSGNVGVGDNSPEQALTVTRPSGTKTGLMLNQNGITAWRIGMAASDPTLRFDANSSDFSTPYMVITQSTGRVGIDTASPGYPLEVKGSGSANIGITTTSGHTFFDATPASGANTYYDNNTVGSATIFRSSNGSQNDTQALSIAANGNVTTAGTINPTNSYVGRAGIGGTVSSTFNVYWTGAVAQLWIDSSNLGNISVSSDERIKKNITPLATSTGLSVIDSLNPVTFNWIDTASGTTTQYGFLAQDVRTVLPDLVSNTGIISTSTPDGLLHLDYNGLFAPIVKAIQEISNVTADFKTNLIAWFANSANGIGDFFAGTVHTQKICVGDNTGETCLTKTQLDALIAGAAGSQGAGSTEQGGAGTSSSDSILPTPDSTSTPVLVVSGNNPASITVGTSYTDLGATITGPSNDTNLGINASVDGGATTTVSAITIDTSVAGDHTITFSVTDGNGLTGTATRTVHVVAPESGSTSGNASSTPPTDGSGDATSTTP